MRYYLLHPSEATCLGIHWRYTPFRPFLNLWLFDFNRSNLTTHTTLKIEFLLLLRFPIIECCLDIFCIPGDLNELNTTFFCSTSPLKAPSLLKPLKLAWRFVLTSCDIYKNPFTQEKILKFWQCRTKKFVLIGFLHFFLEYRELYQNLDFNNEIILCTGVPELRKSSITCSLLKISTFSFFRW
jgi:hypothetical protein